MFVSVHYMHKTLSEKMALITASIRCSFCSKIKWHNYTWVLSDMSAISEWNLRLSFCRQVFCRLFAGWSVLHRLLIRLYFSILHWNDNVLTSLAFFPSSFGSFIFFFVSSSFSRQKHSFVSLGSNSQSFFFF